MNNTFKKTLAGVLALLTVTAYIPGNGIAATKNIITASAEEDDFVASAEEEGVPTAELYEEDENRIENEETLEAAPENEENENEINSAEALEAALENNEVTLDSDIVLTKTLEINGDVRINLNGHQITASDAVTGSLFKVGEHKNLSIADDSDEKLGSITVNGIAAIYLEDHSSCTIESGSVIGTKAGSWLIRDSRKVDCGTTLSIQGNAKVQLSTDQNNSMIAMYGSIYVKDEATLESDAQAIKGEEGSDIHIEGGTIIGAKKVTDVPVVYAYGQADISGGRITAANNSHRIALWTITYDNYPAETSVSGSARIEGNAIVSQYNTTAEYRPNLRVADDAYIEKVTLGWTDGGAAGMVTVTGGTIESVVQEAEFDLIEHYGGTVNNWSINDDSKDRITQETAGSHTLFLENKEAIVSLTVGGDSISISRLKNLEIDASKDEEVVIVSTRLLDITNQGGVPVGAAVEENDGTYTYTFTMPGFDVNVNYVRRNINNNEGADISPDSDSDGRYYPGSLITVTSSQKLNIGYWDENGYQRVEAEETKTDSNYTYTFTMPNADLDIGLYQHIHADEFTVSADKSALIWQCTLDDGECEYQNEPHTKAWLEGGDVGYNGESQPIMLRDEFEPYYDHYSDVHYYRADNGEEVQEWKVCDADIYIVKATVGVGDYEFELEKAFEITPYVLTDANLQNFDQDVYWDGQDIMGPQGWEILGVNDWSLAEDNDFVVTGVRATRKPGVYDLTFYGIGNYTGSFDVTWNLIADGMTELTEDMVTVDVDIRNGFAYATVSVEGFGEGDSYTVGGVTRAAHGGTYTVEIRGTNDLYGYVEKEWSVTEAAVSGSPATIENVVYNTDTSKMTFSALMTAPKGAVMNTVGIVATSNADYADNLSINDAGKANTYVKSADASGHTSAAYTWTKTNVTADQTWYAKSYITYTDATGTHTVYSDLVKATTEGYELIKIGTASISTSSYNVVGENKLYMAAQLSVPNGCTMTKAGLLATTDANKINTLGQNAATNASALTYNKYVENDVVASYSTVNYSWTKTNVKSGDVWYVKPYVVYTDANSTTHVIYGEVTKIVAE